MRELGKITLGLSPTSVESFDPSTGIVVHWDPICAQLVRAKFKGFQVFFIELAKEECDPLALDYRITHTDKEGVRRCVVVHPDLEFIEVVADADRSGQSPEGHPHV